MAVNKVVYGDRTLIDLTGDTVTAADLALGKTAHDASGQLITGTGIIGASGGTATAENILEGKTAYVNGQLITGTMPYNSFYEPYVWTVDEDEAVHVDEGYYDGTQSITLSPEAVNNLTEENIREGVYLLGVWGRLIPLEWENVGAPRLKDYPNYRFEHPNANNSFDATLVYDTSSSQYLFDEYAVASNNIYIFYRDIRLIHSPFIFFFSQNSLQDNATITNAIQISLTQSTRFVFAVPYNGYVTICKTGTSTTECFRSVNAPLD